MALDARTSRAAAEWGGINLQKKTVPNDVV